MMPKCSSKHYSLAVNRASVANVAKAIIPLATTATPQESLNDCSDAEITRTAQGLEPSLCFTLHLFRFFLKNK
jgi:hypothetical protein